MGGLHETPLGEILKPCNFPTFPAKAWAGCAGSGSRCDLSRLTNHFSSHIYLQICYLKISIFPKTETPEKIGIPLTSASWYSAGSTFWPAKENWFQSSFWNPLVLKWKCRTGRSVGAFSPVLWKAYGNKQNQCTQSNLFISATFLNRCG